MGRQEKLAGATGLEPAASCVTGQWSALAEVGAVLEHYRKSFCRHKLCVRGADDVSGSRSQIFTPNSIDATVLDCTEKQQLSAVPKACS